jgi:hypothetical protein
MLLDVYDITLFPTSRTLISLQVGDPCLLVLLLLLHEDQVSLDPNLGLSFRLNVLPLF